MSFEVGADRMEIARLLADVYKRIEERKGRLYTEEELRYISERALQGVLDARDLRGDLLEEFRSRDAQWNYSFDPETLFRSSRGLVGRALETVRRLLRPVQRLFWNPNPMISALSRQSDLNRVYVHLLHNLVLELSRLALDVQELRSRNLELTGRLEALARREKTLEGMVAYRETESKDETGSG
jgi:hypothetical protein